MWAPAPQRSSVARSPGAVKSEETARLVVQNDDEMIGCRQSGHDNSACWVHQCVAGQANVRGTHLMQNSCLHPAQVKIFTVRLAFICRKQDKLAYFCTLCSYWATKWILTRIWKVWATWWTPYDTHASSTFMFFCERWSFPANNKLTGCLNYYNSMWYQ